MTAREEDMAATEFARTAAAPAEVRDSNQGPERHAVADGTEQLGNALSTSAGGGEMSVAPVTAENRNTNLDRKRRAAGLDADDPPAVPAAADTTP